MKHQETPQFIFLVEMEEGQRFAVSEAGYKHMKAYDPTLNMEEDQVQVIPLDKVMKMFPLREAPVGSEGMTFSKWQATGRLRILPEEITGQPPRLGMLYKPYAHIFWEGTDEHGTDNWSLALERDEYESINLSMLESYLYNWLVESGAFE